MDLISTPTPKRSSRSSRDPSTYRRAYLDTYAKKRNPTLTATKSPVSSTAEATLAATAAMPMYNPNFDNSAIKAQATSASISQLFSDTKKIVTKQKINQQPQNIDVRQPQTVDAPIIAENPKPVFNTNLSNVKNELHQQDNVHASAEQPGTTSYGRPQQIDESNEKRISANLRALYMDEDSLTDALVKNSSSSSISHMRTIVASAFACGIIAVSLFTFFGQSGSQPVVAQPVGSPVIEVEAPVLNKPSQASSLTNPNKRVASNPDQPNNIVISGIGVNAPVEAVGMTADGLMAVPKSYGVVGWYNKGVLPGQKGPAVLAGHFTGGYGGVFDKLGDVKDGDLITTTDGKGQSFTFKVTKKVEYDKDKVPMADIFKLGNGPRLEIITCSGKWQAKNYDKRLVVTAELVQ